MISKVRYKIFITLFSIIFLIPIPVKSVFGWQRATNPDCPFSNVFSSFDNMFKEGFQAAKLYFTNHLDEQCTYISLEDSNESLQKEIKKQKKLFGHELSIQYLKDTHAHPSARPTLFFHGWQDTSRSAKVLKRYCKVLPGDIITFNFPDAMPLIAPFWKSSFGQLTDVLPALYTLNYVIKKRNLSSIDLYGISRGGATIVNMIALLHDDNLFEKHKLDLNAIGITHNDRKKLMSVLKNGSIILDTPLRSMKEVAAPLWVVSTCTKYDSQGLDPVENAKLISNAKLKMLVHFQHNDSVVFNTNEEKYFKNLAYKNLANTYLVMGNDGGHIHTHEALYKVIDTFRKISGNTYDKEHDVQHGPIQLINNNELNIENGKLFTFSHSDYIEKAIEKYHQTLHRHFAYQQRPKNYRKKKIQIQ